ncbi:MAG: hypothetical protein LBI87_03970 [Candidatus Accumulibacter sp.]|nr:hypothetical protein [Accumulibacter sp.]
MPTLAITDYLKYANLQMAAEAFIVEENGEPKEDIKQALIEGNNLKGCGAARRSVRPGFPLARE